MIQRAGDIVTEFSSYKEYLKSTGPFALWPLDETSGTTVASYGNSAYNGSSASAQDTRKFFQTTGYNFSTKRANVYTAALNSDMNKNEGSISLWFRYLTKQTWDVATDVTLFVLRADDNNRFIIRQTDPSEITVFRVGGGTSKTVAHSFSTKPLSWQNITITYSVSGDAFKLFVNGVQSGTTQTGNVSFSGSLTSTTCVIGADDTNNLLPCVNICIANVAVWNRVLSTSEVERIASRPYSRDTVTLGHRIKKSWDIFSLTGVAGESLAYFLYDVDGDGELELVANIGRQARFVAIKQNNTILWNTTVDATQAEPTRFGFVRSGNLYFANQGKVYCIRLSDGVALWTTTAITPTPTYIMINQLSTGVVVTGGTKLDVLSYTTGFSIGGNYPVTLATTAWEQSTCTGSLGGNEVISVGDNNSNIYVYNAIGTLRFTVIQNGATQVDWVEFFDVNNDGQNEMVFCTDTDNTSSQVAGEGDELVAYNAAGSQILRYVSPITTGGIQFHCYAFASGGRVVFTEESDYATKAITMLDHTFTALWRINAGTPYEGDQILLYDVNGDGTPEILYSTEVFSENGGLRVLDSSGNRVLFFTEDSPSESDDIVDARGSATNNHQYFAPYYVEDGKLLQGILRTTDNAGHDVIYWHEWYTLS